MSSREGAPQQSPAEQINVCFLNPALLPGWFWLPTAHRVQELGHNYIIPDIPRENPHKTMVDNIDVIEAAMDDVDNQFIVALSRGVEFGVRYIDRLAKQRMLHKVAGWMVISSVGPRGYPLEGGNGNVLTSRHTPGHNAGVKIDSRGMEYIDPHVAEEYLLHDIEDENLRTTTRDNLIHNRPLTSVEVSGVPYLDTPVLPLSWYIGRNDKVDNTFLSAQIASQHFGVESTYTDWGHVGPLSHTSEVADSIIMEAQKALDNREKGQI